MSSLRAKVMLAVSVLAIAAVIAVGVAVRIGARQSFTRYQEMERIERTEKLPDHRRAVAATFSNGCCTQADLAQASALLDKNEALVVVTSEDRIAAAAGAPLKSIQIVSTKRNESGLRIEAESHTGSTVHRVALVLKVDGLPVGLAGGGTGDLYVFRMPNAEADIPTRAFLGTVDRWLFLAIVAVAIVILGITWLLSRRIFDPISQLSVAVRELGRGDLTRRVPEQGSDEVAQLASGFNQMAAELERQRVLRQNLVHDVVHELRTPLTGLRCRLETLADGLAKDPTTALKDANEQVGHLAQLVDDLQEVAQAEARELKFAIADVEVKPVIESALHMAGLADDNRVRVGVEAGVTVRADTVRLRQIMLNLLTNAARHTPAGGTIVVSAGNKGAQVILRVTNSGSSLSEEQLGRVFDRFYRSDESRQRATGGSGLGLAIVKHLAEAQGGRVSASSGADGVTFSVALPRA